MGSAILSLIHSILFYGKGWGVSVAIFVIAFLSYLVFTLYKLEKIQNKKALILLIPILLLSFTYFIFSNYVFSFFNFFAIVFLVALMSYLIINKSTKENMAGVIGKIITVLFGPLGYIKEPFRYMKKKFNFEMETELTEERKIQKSILRGVLLSLPIVIIVVMLLSNADEVFGSIFANILDGLSDNVYSFIFRCICILIIFIYFAGYLYNLAFREY